MGDDQTTRIQDCLDRLRCGDPSGRDDLIRCAAGRLEQLTRAMLRDYARLKRWEETGDVLQGALLRLTRALGQVIPATARDFYRLAAVHIRRELIDLARHYYRPDGPGARHASECRQANGDSVPPAYEQAGSTDEPSRLAAWTELHRQVEALPEEEREVFDLLWYQGLTQPEAARLLDVSERTLKRRWQAARLRLHEALRGEWPGTTA
jgi:RNA polymerase sigma-70 factor (ECF subfamily)